MITKVNTTKPHFEIETPMIAFGFPKFMFSQSKLQTKLHSQLHKMLEMKKKNCNLKGSLD